MRLVKFGILNANLLLIAFFSLGFGSDGSWALNRIFQDFEQAPTISAEQIWELQSNEESKNQIVVVDVRSKVETDISMIPGALTKSEFESTTSQHRDKTIIVYCTIGVRSGDYAAKLRQKGFTALNYEGSILDWCNNEFPLTTCEGENTKRVHTYSSWYSVSGEYVAVY